MKDEQIQQVRDFNRFYTSIIGLLDDYILDSPYSLPEARVLYELYHHSPCTASDLMTAIKMDKGYLSRILKSFIKKGLVMGKKSKVDGRATELMTTAKGKKEFEKINTASVAQVRDILSVLNKEEIEKVIHHMTALKKLLNKPSAYEKE
jgi:DNA-binding MarR family transcriptional regulator